MSPETTTGPWPESTIGQEFEVRLGKRFDAAVNRGTPKPCMTNRGVRWGRVDAGEIVVAPLTKQDIADLRLVAGDVLVCEGGEIGRASVWADELSECFYQNTLHRLRSISGYQPRILVAFLEYWSTLGRLSGLVGKSSLAHLTKENLLRVPIPVPSAAEQSAIAEALSDVDSQISALDRLVAKKRAVKQGLMQQLLAEDAAVRPLSSMLGQLTAGISVNSVTERGMFSILKTSCVSGGEFMPAENKTIAQDEVRRARVNPVAGSLIVSRMNTPNLVGEVGYVSRDWPNLFLPDRLWLATKIPDAQVNMRWLGYALSFPHNSRRIKDLATGTSGSMKNIGKSPFLDFLLPTPSLKRQDYITTVLTDVDAELSALTTRLDKAHAVKQGMMQQLLTGKIRLPIPDSAPEDATA